MVGKSILTDFIAFRQLKIFFILSNKNFMADTNRRIPLWLIAVVGGLAAFSVLGLFLYGSYSGLGSSL